MNKLQYIHVTDYTSTFEKLANLYSDRKRFSKHTMMGRCITVHGCSVYIKVYSKKKGYTNTKGKGTFTHICWYMHKIFFENKVTRYLNSKIMSFYFYIQKA